MSDDLRFKDLAEDLKQHNQVMEALEDLERLVEQTNSRVRLLLAIVLGCGSGVALALLATVALRFVR